MDTSAPWPVHGYYPDGDDPQWLTVYWFARIGDRTELVGFEIKSMPTTEDGPERWLYFEDPEGPQVGPPKPLRSTTLTHLNLDTQRHMTLKGIQEQVLPWVAAMAEQQPEGNAAMWESFADAFDTSRDTRASVGRPPKYGRAHFEFVAQLYRKARDLGVRRTNVWIAEALSEAWGEDVSRKTAERLVHRARHEFGLLEGDDNE